MLRTMGAIALSLLGLLAVGCQRDISQRYVFPEDGTIYTPPVSQTADSAGSGEELTSPASSTAPDADRGQPVGNSTATAMTP